MANEKRLIDANEFWNRLSNVVYDIFTAHAKDGQFTGTASVGYYTTTIEEVLKRTRTVDAVEVVHAEWRIDGFCTNCHYRADVQSIGFNCTGGTRIEYKRTKFCPECGAKMDGERRRINEANLRTER